MPEIVGFGSPRDSRAIQLATRLDTWIPNARQLPLPPQRMEAAVAMIHAEVASACERARESTYNCLGMVFASRRTAIEPEHFELIASDDGYSPIVDDALAKVGDIVAYNTTDGVLLHTALIVDVARNVREAKIMIRVLSQFGYDGEYEHDVDDVPAYFKELGFTRTIWTERGRRP